MKLNSIKSELVSFKSLLIRDNSELFSGILMFGGSKSILRGCSLILLRFIPELISCKLSYEKSI